MPISEKGKSVPRVFLNLPCERQKEMGSKGKDSEASIPLENILDMVDSKEKALPEATTSRTMPSTNSPTNSKVQQTCVDVLPTSSLPSSYKESGKEATASKAKGKEGLATESARSWSQVVQGARRFCWESLRASTTDIAVLEERFLKVIVFLSDEVSKPRNHLKSALLGRFLGRGLPLDFIQKELKL